MLPLQYATPAAIVLVLGGLLACFAGYRLFRFVLGLYGFLLGALVTTSMMGAASTWALVLAAVVGGLIGALLMVAAYFVGVGLIGAGLAALGLNVVWHAVAKQHDPPTVVLVIVAVLGALGALSIVRYVVVFGTALAGSWTMLVGGFAWSGDHAAQKLATSTSGVWTVYPLDPATSGHWWVPVVWIGTALAGVVVQLATTGKTGKKKIKPASN